MSARQCQQCFKCGPQLTILGYYSDSVIEAQDAKEVHLYMSCLVLDYLSLTLSY